MLVLLCGGDGDRRKETLFLVARRPFFSDEGSCTRDCGPGLINGVDDDEGGGPETREARRGVIGVAEAR